MLIDLVHLLLLEEVEKRREERRGHHRRLGLVVVRFEDALLEQEGEGEEDIGMVIPKHPNKIGQT